MIKSITNSGALLLGLGTPQSQFYALWIKRSKVRVRLAKNGNGVCDNFNNALLIGISPKPVEFGIITLKVLLIGDFLPIPQHFILNGTVCSVLSALSIPR